MNDEEMQEAQRITADRKRFFEAREDLRQAIREQDGQAESFWRGVFAAYGRSSVYGSFTALHLRRIAKLYGKGTIRPA